MAACPTLHRATLTLHTPLGTPLAGDTLFGQICWALREAHGNTELVRLLEGYTAGRPWLVVSDGFPAGFLPRPTLPGLLDSVRDPAERKAARAKRWIPVDRAGEALSRLLEGVDDAGAYGQTPAREEQQHNTLNRLTGTTGTGNFAPYSLPRTIHAAGQRMDLYLALDDTRTCPEEVGHLLTAVGLAGYGRDASTGLGKFSLEGIVPFDPPRPPDANAWWTLAPCAPQGLGLNGAQSYWRVLTRFGRHGNAHALAGTPFKTPVLMAATGAVFSPAGRFAQRLWIGQGLGGHGRLSKTEPATVHQGYAPVLSIAMEWPQP